MPGRFTQPCLSMHHASTDGLTLEVSSRVPAFTAMMPSLRVISDKIGDPQVLQKRRRT